MGAKKRFTTGCKTSVLVAAASAAIAASASAQPLPTGGRPGCYVKMAYPPVYRTVTERVAGAPLVSYRDVAPVVQHYTKQVLVTPARIEHETVAPVYRDVSRWVEVPGPTRTVTSPPVYRTVTERRLIAPAHLVWRPGGVAHGFAQSGGYGDDNVYAVRAHPTGEVLCRVLIPARYGWIHRKVLVSPPRQTTVQGPPCRVQVHDRVLVQPGRVVDHTVPAVYRTVDATRIVRPATRQRIVGPGPVQTVSRRFMASPAHDGWSPIVCVPKPVRRHPASTAAYGGQGYGAAPNAPAQSYGGGSYGAAATPTPSQAFRPDEILAPTPLYPQASPPTLVPAPYPAPYDVGHPARQ
jgi:hypothetical protein